MIWFTSDLHFGHANIIRFASRPFADVETMTEGLIERWNTRVQPRDEIYVLGDFCWRPPKYALPILERLRGRKYLVEGNHDRACVRDKTFQSHFAWIKPLVEIKIQDRDAHGGVQRITLCHYPLLTWNHAHRGAWMLHGHSHGSLPATLQGRRIDVGVDCQGFEPKSYDALKEQMAARDFEAVDYHGAGGDSTREVNV